MRLNLQLDELQFKFDDAFYSQSRINEEQLAFVLYASYFFVHIRVLVLYYGNGDHISSNQLWNSTRTGKCRKRGQVLS